MVRNAVFPTGDNEARLIRHNAGRPEELPAPMPEELQSSDAVPEKNYSNMQRHELIRELKERDHKQGELEERVRKLESHQDVIAMHRTMLDRTQERICDHPSAPRVSGSEIYLKRFENHPMYRTYANKPRFRHIVRPRFTARRFHNYFRSYGRRNREICVRSPERKVRLPKIYERGDKRTRYAQIDGVGPRRYFVETYDPTHGWQRVEGTDLSMVDLKRRHERQRKRSELKEEKARLTEMAARIAGGEAPSLDMYVKYYNQRVSVPKYWNNADRARAAKEAWEYDRRSLARYRETGLPLKKDIMRCYDFLSDQERKVLALEGVIAGADPTEARYDDLKDSEYAWQRGTERRGETAADDTAL